MKDYRTSVTNLKLDGYTYSIIDKMSFRVKNLYNFSLYQINQYYNEYKNGKRIEYKDKKGNTRGKGSYIGYSELDLLIKNLTDDKDKKPYRKLPAQISQQTIRKLDQNMKSFFKLLAMKQNNIYDKPVEKPNYVSKDGRKEIILVKSSSGGTFMFKDKYIYISVSKDLHKGRLKLCKVPPYIDPIKIKYLEIVPKFNRYELHITYEIEYDIKIPDTKKWLSIDLGINNLCTITSNAQKAYIINGKPIKSMNKKFNKDLASAKSVLKKSQNKNSSKRIAQLYTKRSNRLNNEMHKITTFIIESIKRNGIDHVVIGYNEGWKDKSSMSRFTNQTFIQIPYMKLINQLLYKLKELGIEVYLQEESYTSKCSYLDNEDIKRHMTYKGKRLNRGLFVSNDGIRLNADVNGSLNIYRKFLDKNVANDVLRHKLEPVGIGLVMNPIKISLRTSLSLGKVQSIVHSL